MAKKHLSAVEEYIKDLADKMAKQDRREQKAFIETLILEEAARRGLYEETYKGKEDAVDVK